MIEWFMLLFSGLITAFSGWLINQNKRILSNQQTQEISTAKILKDIDTLTSTVNDSKDRLRVLEEMTNLQQTAIAEIKIKLQMN